MERLGGESLRAAAPEWSLAGDRQLLALLQEMHQRIMSRCEDTNSQLEDMVTALDTASVALQNVNNRFMALSNSQFIESRVYDDDNEVCVEKEKFLPPTPAAAPSPLAGLLTVERLHEPVPICEDSDSDSGSDQATSVILKPRDPYAARPLPHVIGSLGWKDKWHAGLLAEASDPDSSDVSRGPSPAQYSDTESEPEAKQQPFADRYRDYRESSGTSSERDLTPEAHSSQSVQPSQADIAAELARRLGGFVEPPQSPIKSVDEDAPTLVHRKLYKPQQPTSATIFSDEPPPLAPQPPSRESDVDVYSDADDIFAEINRKAPYSARSKAQNPTDVDIFAGLHSGDDDFGRKEGNEAQDPSNADLFGDSEENDAFVDKDRGRSALVNEIKAKVAGNRAGSDRKADVKQNKPLFDDTEESDLFEEKPDGQRSDDGEKMSVKKLAGAISLFGNNKDAASIGAAILKRNRKSSSEESNNGESDPKSGGKESRNVDHQSDTNGNRADNEEQRQANALSREKVIGKSNRKVLTAKDNTSINHVKDVKEKEMPGDSVKQSEKDIFDDLFEKSAKMEQATVKINKQYGNKKVDLFSDNIFDDIDDIFSSKVVIKKSNKNDKTKSVFDDDDGLFADVNRSVKIKTDTVEKLVRSVEESEDKSIFDSDDDLFSSKKKGSDKTVKNILLKDDNTTSIFDSDDELFSGKKKVPEVTNSNVRLVPDIPTKVKNTKSLFDDEDSEDNDIFSNRKPPTMSQTPAADNKITKIEKVAIVTNESAKNNHQNTVEKVRGPLETDIDNEVATQGLPVDSNSEVEENSKMQTSSDSVKCDTTKENVNILVKSTENDQKTLKSPSIFDDDDDDDNDNLFTKTKVVIRETESNMDTYATNSSKTIDVIKKQTYVKSPSIFDSDGDDDIFAKSLDKAKTNEVSKEEHVQAQIDKLETNGKSGNDNFGTRITEEAKEIIMSATKMPNYIKTIDNATKNLDSNKNIAEKNILFTKAETSNTKFNKDPSIFDDIYTEPPAFKKPTEPKRSKNVNALFDDDSDDESLFFKKNDVISDEKLEDFPVVNEEKTFTIFHDEPPAIDVDSDVNIAIQSDLEIISQQNVVKPFEKPAKIYEKSVNATEKVDVDSRMPEKSNTVENNTTDPDRTDGVIQSKKEPTKQIGKLKPMQFNINVNTLLPGASPKKVVKIPPEPESQLKHDQERFKPTTRDVASKSTDEPTISKAKTEEVTSTLVKSASFEETPDSPVLNNKLSKDRAKIQVKRRPSTRRARIEAARKSAIDFVDGPDDDNQDSDGISNYTDAKKNNSDDNKDDVVEKNISASNATGTKQFEAFGEQLGNEIKVAESGASEKKDLDLSDDFEYKNVELNAEKILSTLDKEFDESSDGNTTVIEKHRPTQGTDESEDLFKQKVMDMAEKVTSKVEKHNITSSDITEKTQVLNINDVDVYIFKDTQVKTHDYDKKDKVSVDKEITSTENNTKIDPKVNTEVQYIGRVYKKLDEQSNESQTTSATVRLQPKSETHNLTAKKTFLFDDLSDDDDLFGGKAKSQKSKPRNEFSDTFNDDSLFATTSSVRKDLPKSVGVKKSLFGDDNNDDDDLFAVKRKTSREEGRDPSAKVTPAPKVTTIAAAPVFSDPLSMFGADEDNC